MSRRVRRKTKPKISAGEWDRLIEEAALHNDFTELARLLQYAHLQAAHKSQQYDIPIEQALDIRQATQLLHRNPLLIQYLRDIVERESSEQSAISQPDMVRSAGSIGQPVQAMQATTNIGGWAGDKNRPQGVMNARILRDWADRSTWVRIALLKLRRWIERADIAVLPADETRPYNKSLMRKVQMLLDQPNEYRDSYRSLIGPVIEDILVLDRGVIEKNMNVLRQPQALYYQDGACIKIYPDWSGDPKEPRYLYDPGGQVRVPLRNDEAIVIMQNISSWRYGYSQVQFLADTIQADIDATLSAIHLVKMKPPPHIVQIPQATGPQLDHVRARYESEFAGRREIMFLGGPATAHVFPLIFSAKDQQWLEWQVYMARKIATIFGIAPQELGITTDTNKATAQVMHTEAENSGYLPLLLLLEEYLNRELLADFAPRAEMDRALLSRINLRIVYPEISEAARQFHAEKAVDMATRSLAGLPSATLNQMLSMRGEKPVAGGDTFWVMTGQGPMPWLSYDDDYGGDYTPRPATGGELGAQDAAGGVTADAEDQSAPANQQAISQAVQSPIERSMQASHIDALTIGKQPKRLRPAFDARPPGKRWQPQHQRSSLENEAELKRNTDFRERTSDA